MSAVKVKTKAKATKAKAGTKATAKGKASGNGRQKHDREQLRKRVGTALGKGTKISAIAKDLGITPGLAAYLNMLNEVDDNPRLRIKGRNDEEKVANVIKERHKQDEHSGWGWLSARSGIPEPRLKTLCEAAGEKVKGSHIATERKSAREGSKPAKAAKAKTAAKGKAGTKVKVSAKGKKANPSK